MIRYSRKKMKGEKFFKISMKKEKYFYAKCKAISLIYLVSQRIRNIFRYNVMEGMLNMSKENNKESKPRKNAYVMMLLH